MTPENEKKMKELLKLARLTDLSKMLSDFCKDVNITPEALLNENGLLLTLIKREHNKS